MWLTAHDLILHGGTGPGRQSHRCSSRPIGPGHSAILFDTAEAQLGPANLLVNNATGWVADTFAPSGTDRLGRLLRPVSAATWQQQFTRW